MIGDFLINQLKLFLHPDKVFIKTIASGVDFLGWMSFCDHWILRRKTKDKMLKRIKASPFEKTLQSYLGLLKHGDTNKSRGELLAQYWLWREV